MIGYLADHCNVPVRVLLFVAGLLMIVPGVMTDGIGIVIFGSILFWQMRLKKKKAAIAG